MAETKSFKCLNCGAPIVFSPINNNWECKYCYSSFTQKQLEDAFKIDQQEAENLEQQNVSREERRRNIDETNDQEEIYENLDIFQCESCGAELIGDDNLAATFCRYCKSPNIIKSRLVGAFKPDFVVPFKITQDKAKDLYKSWIKKKLFAPKLFKEDEEIDKVSGIYAPFRLFDCDGTGQISGDATIVRTWRSGDYEYTETKFYAFERAGNALYQKIPVDASSRLDDTFMEMIEPYNYNEMIDFSMGYLSGFFAEKYDVELESCQNVVQQRAKDFLTSRLERTVTGYSTVSVKSASFHTKRLDDYYALMPIYLLVNKYKDKNHTFIINGQTGKVVGDTPFSFGRAAAFWGGLTLILYIILTVGGAIIG